MFTGIIQTVGLITHCDLEQKWGRISISVADQTWEPFPKSGESVAVQGVCLTVTECRDRTLSFDILRETFERTTLSEKGAGDHLNLERSLAWGQDIGGHIVIGHVDGVGRVREVFNVGRDFAYYISCDDELLDGMVQKGSIAVDGVSLTIADLKADGFVVHIIPYTREHTTFGELQVGDTVNLELDILWKYVRRLLERKILPFDVTWERLRHEGLIPAELME